MVRNSKALLLLLLDLLTTMTTATTTTTTTTEILIITTHLRTSSMSRSRPMRCYNNVGDLIYPTTMMNIQSFRLRLLLAAKKTVKIILSYTKDISFFFLYIYKHYIFNYEWE